MSESDGGDWASSEAKDWKDGRHKRDNRYVLPHAGQIEDRDAEEMLRVLELVYRRADEYGWLSEDKAWPESVQDLTDYNEIRTKHESETFARRVDEGASAQLRQHVGTQSEDVDVSGWDDIERIRDIAGEQPLMLYIYGDPGSGKTSSALKITRHHVEQVEERTNQRVRVITNIRTAVEQTDRIDDWIHNWGQLKREMVLEEDEMLKEEPQPIIFVFDEASSHASGRGSDGWETAAKLATLIYKIRKYGGSIIIIGHDGKDLHPAVREMCKVLYKMDKQTAQFFENVKNRTPIDAITPPLKGWTDTKWDYHDRDPASWSWENNYAEDGDEDGDDGISRQLAYDEMATWTVVHERQKDDPLSHAKIASQRLDGLRSSEWVRKRWKKYQKGELDEVVGMVEKVMKP